MEQNLYQLLHNLLATAKQTFHRYALVFAGEQGWCHAHARQVVDAATSGDVLWVGPQDNQAGETFIAARAQHYLGMEFQAVVFDVYAGFDPDVFSAVSGTLKGGGLFIVLCPPLDEWRRFDDPQKSRLAIWPYHGADIGGRFLHLVANGLKQDNHVVVVEQGQALPSVSQPTQSIQSPPKHREAVFPYRSADQQRAVHAITQVVSGHRHRPLVITSDRGRGKSAALGIAAAQLMMQGTKTILVTAPRHTAVSPVFSCAQSLLPDSNTVKGKLRFDDAVLMFVAPDELLQQKYECNLLMVDEAAAIPAALLERFLKHYARIVFSTTVHGYEGTGRGFVLRFHDTLNRYTPGWKSLALETPIRWAKRDPLESLVFNTLLLNANPAADEVARSVDAVHCRCETLDRDQLLNHPGDLRQLFALLVLAHYQTQPADLRYLLDARDVRIDVVRYGDNIVAAALLEEEGAFDAELAAKVYANERRVRGHLLAQSLATYAGLPEAPQLRYARIMRIAVHPLAQQQGLGTLLLQHIETSLPPETLDLWGASFGATPQLLRFWRRNGFVSVHIGMSRNAASGMHSALVLKPLSERGIALLHEAQRKFNEHFPAMLAEPYRDLDPPLVNQLLNAIITLPFNLSEADRQDIQSFMNSARGYEVNSVPLWKLACMGLTQPPCSRQLTEIELAIVISKVMQKKPWAEVASACGLAGRKQALAHLRQAVKKLHEYGVQNTDVAR